LFERNGNFIKDYEPDFDVKDFRERVQSEFNKKASDAAHEPLKVIADSLGLTTTQQGPSPTPTAS